MTKHEHSNEWAGMSPPQRVETYLTVGSSMEVSQRKYMLFPFPPKHRPEMQPATF